MYCGFDYGTSNCAMGVFENNEPQLIPLEGEKVFLPSALYAFSRDFITEGVAKSIQDEIARRSYIESRKAILTRAQRVRREEDYQADDQVVFYGREAFSEYYSYPDEGYFIKSPKSFLGGSGLRNEHIRFFEDIVTLMMLKVKRAVEIKTGKTLTQTVIGRPVNFQGIDAEASNKQALDILMVAAKRVGFQDVEFLFEPIAAGMDFERRLETDQTVLVVDIGGGTTDCAVVRMGPSYREKLDRTGDFLAHTGERVGGNDLDIQLAGKEFMPLFGMGAPLKTGLPMPTQLFWNAVTTNDVSAQTIFNSLETKKQIDELRLDTTTPALIDRFAHLREHKHNFHLVRNSEEAKINLSEMSETQIPLDYIEKALSLTVSRDQLGAAITPPLEKMMQLMSSAIEEAGEKPDVIYITGGSAKSPIIQQQIRERIGDIPVLDGDHFGSVASGLTVWAAKIYK
ncbi:molecular chaperone [Marinomonas balearica]|uniref:Putative chaperone protein n=1 Tax=Marinomonas balearica TaxID=491947 RepID=A0A4R6MCR6_9GAMM|nr:molecular chaperone [Marinomonas balearica]TDO99448.1 putative chaperone protein [Marinomonas balearica]